jgi:putative effector of murein hydrolase
VVEEAVKSLITYYYYVSSDFILNWLITALIIIAIDLYRVHQQNVKNQPALESNQVIARRHHHSLCRSF